MKWQLELMDYYESDIMANRARRETEAFINNNIHNHTKKWPRICHSQIFIENTNKSPSNNRQNKNEKSDSNFDTQILSCIA